LDVSTTSLKKFQLGSDPKTIDVLITVSEDAPPGTYKILLGAQSNDVSISKYLTLVVQP